jgi:hypothetical protein
LSNDTEQAQDSEFTLSDERAVQIRSILALFKDKSYVADLKLLVTELGTEEDTAGHEEDPELPGLKQAVKLKRYVCPEDQAASGFSIEEVGTEMRVFVNQRSVVELGFLPKDNESVVFYIDESLLPELEAKLGGLGGEVKRAKAIKSERKDVWKKRFGEPVADEPVISELSVKT